jgi:hypothetical protein
MIPLLLSLTLSCSEAVWIIDGILQTDVGSEVKIDLIDSVMESTEPNCDFNMESNREPRR